MPGVARIGPKRPIRVYLAEWREDRGLTQVQLAERLGVTDMTVSRWERACANPARAPGTALPNTNVLAAICEALGGNLEVRDLYRHPDTPSADALLRGQPAPVRDAAISRVIDTIRRAAKS